MGLQGYVGSADDQARIRRLEKEREEERQRLEAVKKEATSQPAGFRNWRQGTAEKAETAFRQETIGLISREEYIQKKESVKQRLAAEAYARKRKQQQQEQTELAAKRSAREQQRKQAKLSFLDDEDEDEEGDGDAQHDGENGGTGACGNGHAPPRLTKNSDVPTGFLPDTDRDLAIEKAKQELQRQWSEQQEELKQQNIQVPFSYWDGSGHQRSAAVAVGGTIEDFLKVARGVMEKDFPQMRHAAVSNLMVVAHDVMLPQACSFHKLIVGKAQNGKGEVLFELDNQNKSAHSIKVLLRSWYESNKHIYPANRWQLFDEDVHIP